MTATVPTAARFTPAARFTLAALLIAATQLVPVGAAAIDPPGIDRRARPTAGPIAPNEPTQRRTLCARPVTTRPSATPAAQRLLNLPAAWRLSRGSGQKVAVIDTGVTPHRRLPDIIGGGDYVSAGKGLDDCDAHGTLVAGIIAARPSPEDRFSGVAPEATIIAIRQSSGAYAATGSRRTDNTGDDTAVGSGYGTISTLARAVVRAVDLGATVINISEVACVPAAERFDDRSLGAAIRYAFDRNVVVVAAAGNLSSSSQCRTQNPEPAVAGYGRDNSAAWRSVVTVASPAWFSPYVLAVGAVDSADGSPADFSIHGPWVGVAAPGTDIVSLTNASHGLAGAYRSDDGSVPIRGTSFAAPYVAGTAALVRSRFPQLSAAQVIDRIVRTAQGRGSGHDVAVGYGVVDPVAALTTVLPDESNGGGLYTGGPVEPRSTPVAAPPVAPSRTGRHATAHSGVRLSASRSSSRRYCSRCPTGGCADSARTNTDLGPRSPAPDGTRRITRDPQELRVNHKNHP